MYRNVLKLKLIYIEILIIILKYNIYILTNSQELFTAY